MIQNKETFQRENKKLIGLIHHTFEEMRMARKRKDSSSDSEDSSSSDSNDEPNSID
ncbi:MAG: hypothetical protein Ta2E_11100 [Mycoplasmoidaceae bacterium]|nr:MAG: hypothetical protein Ta2E_11100 [Mycoplasmoidaceae bacterium]